ncbi:MAG TPA: Gfo/Idh/MocA family oxidoreductase [Capsulimonadaceae bacterium]|nr:Gfo/Idh/MocA family oxidoreductase [Capsulimonadaceae bacterium]
MSDHVGIGFVGCGGMARAHADAIKDISGAKIVGVTDASPEAATAFCSAHSGALVFDSPEELAASADVDCLFLLLPPFAHGDAERAAIKHKKPFFIEKPVGLDKHLLNTLSREVQESGLMTCAGYMNRYRRSVNTAKEMLANDPPHLAYGAWFGGARAGLGTSGIGLWWLVKEKSGGQFHEQVTHTVDLARYLFGEAKVVSAFAANGFNKPYPGVTADDAMVVNIQFESGAVANLMGSIASNAKGGVFLTVLAKDHAFEFTGWENSVIIHRKGEEEGGVIKGEDNIFRIEDQIFLDAVRSGDGSAIRSTYPDAAKTALLTVAANESIAAGGQPIKLS